MTTYCYYQWARIPSSSTTAEKWGWGFVWIDPNYTWYHWPCGGVISTTAQVKE